MQKSGAIFKNLTRQDFCEVGEQLGRKKGKARNGYGSPESDKENSPDPSEPEGLLEKESVIEAEEVLPPPHDEIESWERLPEKAGPRDVVPYDALSAYLREISRYPQLSREEEFQLAVRYREHKDLNAAYKLVLGNLWLVVRVARDYEAAARNVLDLIQEGNIGLMEAVKNFDPYKEVRFPSYAVWWIKAYIIRFVIANWRLVKIGTTQAQRKLFFNLKKEKERLEREGFTPLPALIAERLSVKESEVVEMEQRLGSSEVSMDAPMLQEDSETNLGAILPSDNPNAEELLSRKQLKEMLSASLEEFCSTLNKKELAIFHQRLLGEEKATLQELADKFSLSKERVRQLENKIKEKLRVFLTAKFGSNLQQMDLEL